MNITFFITTLGGGGAERVLCNIANYLDDRGHDVHIAILRGKEVKYELNASIKLFFLQEDYYKKKVGLVDRIREVRVAKKYLKNLDAEGCLVSFLELPMALTLISRSECKKPVIICERNYPESYSKIYRMIFKKMSNRANGCVCQTKMIQDWYQPFLNCGVHSIVIPNALGAGFQTASYSPRNSKRIVSVGRLEPQKNQKLLIEAFALISNKYNDYSLTIYGAGPLEGELKQLSKVLGLQEKINFPGFKPDIIHELLNSDLFVLTSDFEGMPNVLAEAMAVGLPCISTDCRGGGARALIQNEVNGIIVPCNDKNGIANAMSRVIDDNTYADKLARNARNIRHELLPDRINKQWEDYLSLFDNK